MSKLAIETTQNVPLEFEVAPIEDRIKATLIDWLILIAYILVSSTFFYNFYKFGSGEFKEVMFVIHLIPFLLYELITEFWMNGQTFGKKAVGLRVISMNGTNPGVSQFLIRWLLRFVDISLFSGSIAMFTMILNGKGQRLGDIAAGTTVVRIKQKTKIADTILILLGATYQPKYQEVIRLSDHDIMIIHKFIQQTQNNENKDVLSELAETIKTHLEIKTEEPSLRFLQQILRDYNYYSGKI